MTNGGTHWAADEIVAPDLVVLKTWYDQTRGSRPMAGFTSLPSLPLLPAAADLALVEIGADTRFSYLAMGEGYRRTAALKPDSNGVTIETRPVVRQHFGLAIRQRSVFHVSVTRWDGPKILQFDRVLLPLDDGAGGPEGGEVTHLLVGEVFLRYAKAG